MTTAADFKELIVQRLKTIQLLKDGEEWAMAAYLLGFVLECALKAASCKALHLESYPEPNVTKNNSITGYFCTHNFDMLLAISGVTDLFSFPGKGASAWSGFIQEYQGGNYTSIRYDNKDKFDRIKVDNLYKLLTEEPNGIIPLMKSEKRW